MMRTKKKIHQGVSGETESSFKLRAHGSFSMEVSFELRPKGQEGVWPTKIYRKSKPGKGRHQVPKPHVGCRLDF